MLGHEFTKRNVKKNIISCPLFRNYTCFKQKWHASSQTDNNLVGNGVQLLLDTKRLSLVDEDTKLLINAFLLYAMFGWVKNGGKIRWGNIFGRKWLFI